MEVKGNAGFSGIAGVPEIHPNLKPVSTSNVQFVDPSGNPLTRFVVNSTVSDGALAPKNTTYSINDMALRSPRALKLEIADIKKHLQNHDKNIELVFSYLDELTEKKENESERVKIGYKK